jgi:acyl carrier protein
MVPVTKNKGSAVEQREATFDRIKNLISEMCAVDPAIINKNARLRGFGVDSVRVMELVLCIEDEFQIQLEREDLSEISTVGELADYINSLRTQEN